MCNYARIERGSDISIGDSWGTELSSEEKNGISVVLCQTEKGKALLLQSKLALFDVDLNKAIEANHQLRHPSEKPAKRDIFFNNFYKTGSVEKSVFLCFQKECIRQKLKGILIKTAYQT